MRGIRSVNTPYIRAQPHRGLSLSKRNGERTTVVLIGQSSPPCMPLSTTLSHTPFLRTAVSHTGPTIHPSISARGFHRTLGRFLPVLYIHLRRHDGGVPSSVTMGHIGFRASGSYSVMCQVFLLGIFIACYDFYSLLV